MSVLEAMGHGLPVVVPHVGGFPEIVVDGECGHLVAERGADLFARKIFCLVDLEQRKKWQTLPVRELNNCFPRKPWQKSIINFMANC